MYCPDLDTPANGTKIENGTACGSIVLFFCDSGLELRGSDQRECLSNGSWSGQETTCDG